MLYDPHSFRQKRNASFWKNLTSNLTELMFHWLLILAKLSVRGYRHRDIIHSCISNGLIWFQVIVKNRRYHGLERWRTRRSAVTYGACTNGAMQIKEIKPDEALWYFSRYKTNTHVIVYCLCLSCNYLPMHIRRYLTRT